MRDNNENFFDVFSSRIKERREVLDMSATNAAIQMGITRGYLSNLEAQVNTPGVLTLVAAMAKIYQTSVDYLLGNSNDPRGAKEEAAGAGRLFRVFDQLDDFGRRQLIDIANGLYISQLRQNAIAGDDDAVVLLMRDLGVKPDEAMTLISFDQP